MPFGITARQLIAAGQEHFDRLKKANKRGDDKRALLKLLRARLEESATAHELAEPLEPDGDTRNKAVLMVTSPIDLKGVEVTRVAHRALEGALGLSLHSLSHWAICVVDRGPGACYLYDLMSDQLLPATRLRRTYPRCFPVTETLVARWNGVSYVGETTRDRADILEIASRFVSDNPKYKLLSNNCQHLAEVLVSELCDGRVISQANLGIEVQAASARIRSMLMMKMHLDDTCLRGFTSDIKAMGDGLPENGLPESE